MDSADEGAAAAAKPFLSSSEVVERLGISKATLYAYVSRGLIRSEPVPDAPRTRRYRADDVERLLHRQRLRSDPESSAGTALDWGAPVLESNISMISNGRLYYRGRDAVEMAGETTFERAIALLWLDDPDAPLPGPSDEATTARREAILQIGPLLDSVDPLSRVQTLLPALEQCEPAAFDARPETSMRIGIDIIQLVVGALVGAEGQAEVARTLQAYWAPGQSEVADLIDAALVLSADHELNISTFTVRCIASARAPLHAAVSGGLSALRGYKHGGATLQAAAMLREVGSPDAARSVLRDRIRRGDRLAGFGHRLYPNGDPRGEKLLKLIRDSRVSRTSIQLSDAICQAAEDLQGLRPNLDYALAVLAHALGQPADAGMSLMALGRIAGWIAHAQEEYERDQLIRPRARYGS